MQKVEVEKLATDHVRFIGQLSYSYWCRLPQHAKSFIDVDDLIAGAVVCIVEKAHLYKSNVSQPVTFVGMITIHYLENVLNQFNQLKRRAVAVVPVEDWNTPLHADAAIKWHEAKVGFEMVLEFASDDLRLALDYMLHERRFPKQRTDGVVTFKPTLVDELKSLTKRCGVTRNHMEQVFAVV